MSTRRPNRKVSNYTDDRWINPQRWEETSEKRSKTLETRTPHLLDRTKTPHQQGNKAGWRMSVDELTESDFRRWVMRNFRELKEHVLTQCKETKNLEKRFEEMITRMDNLERNMNELKKLKNTTRDRREACTNFNS